jgi:hypothetical protein
VADGKGDCECPCSIHLHVAIRSTASSMGLANVIQALQRPPRHCALLASAVGVAARTAPTKWRWSNLLNHRVLFASSPQPALSAIREFTWCNAALNLVLCGAACMWHSFAFGFHA